MNLKMIVLYPHFGREFHKHIKKRTVDYTALSSFTNSKINVEDHKAFKAGNSLTDPSSKTRKRS